MRSCIHGMHVMIWEPFGEAIFVRRYVNWFALSGGIVATYDVFVCRAENFQMLGSILAGYKIDYTY